MNYPDCLSSPLAAEQNGVAISTNGNELAYATGHSVVERNLVSGRQTTLTLTQLPTRVLMSADGTRVLVVADNALRVWTPADGQTKTISVSAVPLAAALDTAGDRAVIGNTDGTTSVWNLTNGTRIAQFAKDPVLPNDQQDPEPLQVAISSDGAMIATGDTNGLVRLRSVAERTADRESRAHERPERERHDLSDRGTSLREFGPWTSRGELPADPGGRLLATRNRRAHQRSTGTVDSRLSSPAQSMPPFEPGLDVSGDGQFVLTGIEGFAPAGQQQGEDAVYDATTGDKLADLSEAAPAGVADRVTGEPRRRERLVTDGHAAGHRIDRDLPLRRVRLARGHAGPGEAAHRVGDTDRTALNAATGQSARLSRFTA